MSILCPIDVLHTIMENILEFLRNDESIGLVSRMPKQGPELELVQDFVIHLKENLYLTYINNCVIYKYHLPNECVNQKREPFPGSELTPMRPPTCSTILLQIDNPKPVP